MAWLPRVLLPALCGACFVVLTLRAFSGVAAGAETCRGQTPTVTVYLPNVTKTLGGPGGWVTPIYVQNAGAVQTTVEMSFLRFRDGALIACHRTSGLAPGTSFVDNPNEDSDLPDDTQFSVVVRSFGAPIVAIVNELQHSGAAQQALAYSGFTRGDLTVYLPNVTRRFFGYDVPFIVQNVGATTATASARFISFDGRSTFIRGFTIAPGRSYVVDPDFEPAYNGAANSGLIDGTQYAVTLTSDQPIAVVVNAHNETGAPVAFSHDGIGRGATTLYAPYAAKAVPPGNTFSPIVVQNVGTTATDAVLVFTSAIAGVAPQSFTLRAIPAGGAQAFDPRFAVGTTTPCGIPSATCLGAGEYSVTISAANPVAAVVLPNSATTAGAYLASAELAPRAIIPVAFRRIGGWSTRMVVRTGVPAQLTARAYEIPSGDLKATFVVPVGPTGWTSFDLDAVAGLSVDAQYAVTIDGGGVALTAVALEQGSGGDAFMVFEGVGTRALDPVPSAASIRVTPPASAMTVGWTQQFAATVKDQFGVALPADAVTAAWTLTPATLGTLSPSGRFTAGASAGTGTVAVSVGAVVTQAPITVSVPPTVSLAGLSFWAFAANGADVYTETTIGAGETQTVVTGVEADIAQVQSDYGRRYAARPAVYALGSSSTFFWAIQGIGGSTSPTPTWASGVCICAEPHPGWVFVNWSLARATAQPTTSRHELTHVIEHEAAAGGTLPAWFDEGNARVEEFTMEGTRWFAALQRYRAASMAARGSLFTLDELTSQRVWNERSDIDATYEYAVASQAVALLRDDIGMSGEQLLFALMGQGRTFDEAYELVAGRPLSDFGDALAARIGALAASIPGIAAAPDTLAGPGLTFIIYGLPANAPFTYQVTGPSSSRQTSAVADPYGVFYTYLGSSWPPGSYVMTVSWTGGTLSGSGVNPP